MANLLHNGRYVLDTAESVVAAGTTLRLASVWFIGTTNEDDCILHDGNGKVIWACKLGTLLTGVGNQCGHNFGIGGQIVDGLDLDTIDHGILIVYLAKK